MWVLSLLEPLQGQLKYKATTPWCKEWNKHDQPLRCCYCTFICGMGKDSE